MFRCGVGGRLDVQLSGSEESWGLDRERLAIELGHSKKKGKTANKKEGKRAGYENGGPAIFVMTCETSTPSVEVVNWEALELKHVVV